VKEETGVNIGDVRFKGITNDLFEVSEKHYITIWMEARYLDGEPVVNADREASDIGWFSWDALPKPLFLPLQNFMEGRLWA
jgi:8-oxo-dGTP diphosphatase